LEVLVIVAGSLATGTAYHFAFYGHPGQTALYAGIGVLIAILFEVPMLMQARQQVDGLAFGQRGIGTLAKVWTGAFLCLVVIGFLTKTSDQFSRGWLLLYYCVGFCTLIGLDHALRRGLKAAAKAGLIAGRRLVVIGARSSVERFERSCLAVEAGLEIVATSSLPRLCARNPAAASDELAHMRTVVERARRQWATDIVILSDRPQDQEAIAVVEMFLDLPVALHLGQSALVEHFPQRHASQLGGARTLTLRHEQMNVFQLIAKRALDSTISAVALVLLSPLLLLVGLLIRLDSAGPVFFRQRRRGFNHHEFRIWKFRTMTTLDDGDVVVQARSNDARVTRVGRILRKYNIDELPQLANVLSGTMSLVGPRPHAVAHDKQLERTIARYAGRLNVKPGIAGWAQIYGCRGETRTDDAMQSWITHDLYYIENWSLSLDVYIMAMTFLSQDAYRNAH
jgi:Undecaprenyl-phosphate glucose phosphotransferase